VLSGIDDSIVCFNKGTLIECLDESGSATYLPIESLKKGDLVNVYREGGLKISHIGKRNLKNGVDTHFTKNMYKMKEAVDGFEKLVVTGGHSILVDELNEYELEHYKSINFLRGNGDIIKIKNKCLSLAGYSNKFEKIEDNEIYTYYHLVLDGEEEQYGIWANGVLTETCSKTCYFRNNLC